MGAVVFNGCRSGISYLLWQELEAAAKEPKTPLEKKFGDYYAACMDTDVD